MDKTGIHFYSGVVHPCTRQAGAPTEHNQGCHVLPALHETPEVCPKELCATDIADGDFTNTQTDSPSALCDFPAHHLKAPQCSFPLRLYQRRRHKAGMEICQTPINSQDLVKELYHVLTLYFVYRDRKKSLALMSSNVCRHLYLNTNLKPQLDIPSSLDEVGIQGKASGWNILLR